MKTELCRHEPRTHGRFTVVACHQCGAVEWFERGEPAAAEVAMAGLFGDFDLVAKLPALRAPGTEVFLYRPPDPGRRRSLSIFPSHVWFEAATSLWLCHDGQALMLAPTDPNLVDNLTRGA